MRDKTDSELLRLEQRAAISQIRTLDRHHLRRIAAIHREFDRRRATLHIPGAGNLVQALQNKLASASLVLVAGGHVAVLINRIRLFRLEALLAQKAIIAWSAGAMVLSERIVLFHDDAPQGKRDPEVLDTGLGIVKQVVLAATGGISPRLVKSQPHGTIQPPLCTCKMLYTGQWFNDPLAGWLHGFRAVMLNGNPKWDEKNGANKMNPILASLYRRKPRQCGNR
ncbi:MAG: Type 1 glutamine amidotransferase-like domain-containing protein [Thiolinea sp.]